MHNLNRRTFIKAAGAASALPLIGGQAFAQEALKVGYIYVGPINDGGWNTAHEAGRQQMLKTLGDKVTSVYVENVPEGPDAERVLRDLANQGCKLLYATSFGFMDSAVKVARAFPDIKVEMCTGFKPAPNLSNYNIRFHQARSILGTIAGMMSKTGVGGYLGTYPVPEVVSGINSFTIAARKVNPNFKTKVIWVNTWFDPAKEADAARALIDQGVDVMTQHTDSPAAVQVCEGKNVITFGQGSDQSQFAPSMCKTSSLDLWGSFYTQRTQAVVEGTWKPEDTYWGIKEGALDIAEIKNVPDDVKAAAEKVKQGWIDGTYNCYAGPIKDQQGNEKCAAGAELSDADILGMNWLVEGVDGTLG
ncbi:MAG TPA: BMP family ABC transporter substrate-binding protein [Devosiaceae bacterium]|jgi:simple sugar transport system substrate-binding protein